MSNFVGFWYSKVWLVLFVWCFVETPVRAQDMDCYGPGSIAGAVLGTFAATLLLIGLLIYGYKWFLKNRREKHLVLETDPEHGDKYAFDNPCFKDAGPGGLTPIGKALDKSGTRLLDTGKKWSQWSPLGAFVSTKNEKKRTLDDSYLEGSEVKIVGLRSHDFTGLGFNICGNMRDGIYIKDVLHRGPASESGKLNPGDRINSVRISFENMVYEDALTILSYASPYEVEVEAKSMPKGYHQGPPGSGGQGAQPKHPIYRSSSSSDLVKIGKSARRLFLNGETLDTSLNTNYPTLPYSSNNTTLERGRKSPKTDVNSLTKPERTKKSQAISKNLSPEQLKAQLEQNLSQKITAPMQTKSEAEKQTTEADGGGGGGNVNRFQKMGVKVLPMETKVNTQQPTRSPKAAELSQNDNNINKEIQENGVVDGVDEVDKKENRDAPPIKRREKNRTEDVVKEPIVEHQVNVNFERESTVYGSGIKRDKSGIPQEIPEHMLQAAVVARKNRKSQEILDKVEVVDENSEQVKSPKKLKGKAPAPPPVATGQEDQKPVENQKSTSSAKLNFSDNFDEISTLEEDKEPKPEKKLSETMKEDEVIDIIKSGTVEESKDYCSDSDMETDNQSSVNTIELNSSDITIHHQEQAAAEMKGRKTASTGDLSKLHQKEKKSNTGTLERAQSLDITDSGIPTLNKKRKATKDNLDLKLSSDESLYEETGVKVKEPRLSLALDGLDTFQRNRLKKSSEWGNLEDVILNLDKVEPEVESSSIDEIKTDTVELKSPIKFDFGTKDTTFGTSITTLSDIHVTLVDDDVDDGVISDIETVNVKNTVWPSSLTESNIPDDSMPIEKVPEEILKPQIVDKKDKVIIPDVGMTNNVSVHNIVWPVLDADKSNTEPSDHDVDDDTLTHVTSFSLKDTFQEKLNNKISNNPTESKTSVENSSYHPGKSSQNFIFAEKYASNNDCYDFPSSKYDLNVSDDIKVSRHSLGSLERPKSDVLKSVNKLKMQNMISSDQGGVSNVTVTEALVGSYENGFQLNADLNRSLEASELYTTANDVTIQDDKPESDQIKNRIISETITDTKYYTDGPSSLTIDTSSDGPDSIKSNTLTFVTEIQVSTPSNNSIEITSSTSSSPESNANFQDDKDSIKKLPEMKFVTSSYESPKTPEKRISQIELLRSNFEKSPPKIKTEISPSKSRIPVATKIDFKSPSSPERRIGEMDVNDKEIIEIMSTAVHSTPIVSNQKIPPNSNKTPTRNITVTSIKSSSKIPSGSTSYSNNKPPVPARPDSHESSRVSANGTESTFKQWVFNPNENSVTNIVVNNSKESHK